MKKPPKPMRTMTLVDGDDDNDNDGRGPRFRIQQAIRYKGTSYVIADIIRMKDSELGWIDCYLYMTANRRFCRSIAEVDELFEVAH